MKKILLAILAMSVVSVANATTTSSNLTLNGSVVSSCTSALSAGTLSFTFVPGSQPSSQTTNLTVTCTADSVISSLTSTSSNGWRFVGATHGDYVNYSMRVNSITGTYFDDINNSYAMSGSSGSTSPVTVNSSPIAIDASATPLTMGIGVSPVTVPATTAVDTYSDTVTISTTF